MGLEVRLRQLKAQASRRYGIRGHVLDMATTDGVGKLAIECAKLADVVVDWDVSNSGGILEDRF